MLGDTKNLMFNTIVKGLMREGYEVMEMTPDYRAIRRLENEAPNLWIMYFNGDIADFADLLDHCGNKNFYSEKKVALVGDGQDIDFAAMLVPKDQIITTFKRPVNVKQLVAKLRESANPPAAGGGYSFDPNIKKKILIIDDDPTMLRMIYNMLNGKYEVYMASSGMDGLKFLANYMVDLILLDYEMPIMSGAQVMQTLRDGETTKNIPVMFLTGKNDKETVMKVLSLKPVRYILKSIAPAEWVRDIDDFFESNAAK